MAFLSNLFKSKVGEKKIPSSKPKKEPDISKIGGKKGKLLKVKQVKLPTIHPKKISEIKKELEKHRKLKDKKLKELSKKDEKIAISEVKVVTEKPSKSQKKSSYNLPEFFKTYVPGFDELVHPGLPRGSSILVEGGPGSGKTLWCLTLLKEMCKRGKKVLYMSFEEPEDRLRSHIDSFGVSSRELEKKGILYIKRFNALDIARSVEALLSEAKKELLIEVQPVLIPHDFEPDIVVIDSLSSISSAFSGESSRFRIYMEQLFRYLEAHNITSFLIREVASPTHIGGTFVEQGEAVSFLSDGIIALYNVIYDTGIRKRAFEILKMRGVSIERKIVEYELTGKGVIIRSKRILKGKYTLA